MRGDRAANVAARTRSENGFVPHVLPVRLMIPTNLGSIVDEHT